jgi:hypothetical protein
LVDSFFAKATKILNSIQSNNRHLAQVDEDSVQLQQSTTLFAPALEVVTHLPGSPSKRKRRTGNEKSVVEEDEEENMNENSSTDPNETYTWSELIERALLSLGGSRTGHEITDWIEEKFGHIVNHKTKTWKNSVFG